MSRLTVLCWLWKQKAGRTSFTAMHVNLWAAMVRRHCTLDISLACVTDMPEGIDKSIRIIKPPGEFIGMETAKWRNGRPNCYRRLSMFKPGAGRIFGKRFCAMDLDCVIGANIDAILSRPEDFVICGPSRVGRRWLYNGSMMLMTAGARPQVYGDFTPARAETASSLFVGSDQAWLGHVLGPGEATFGPEDGVVRWGAAKSGSIMFFPGTVKPWDVLGDEWVGRHYRLGSGGSGLVLGRRSSVWDEARAALDEQAFDGVIALAPTAARWPGPIAAIADSMPHARALARMLGFDRLTECGA